MVSVHRVRHVCSGLARRIYVLHNLLAGRTRTVHAWDACYKRLGNFGLNYGVNYDGAAEHEVVRLQFLFLRTDLI